MKNVTNQRWVALCDRLGFTVDNCIFEEMLDHYLDLSRHYHDMRHIESCLGHFDTWQGLAEHPDEVEFSLWLHDVIYDTRCDENEGKSAEFAAGILHEGGCDPLVISRVIGHILATAHDKRIETYDARLTADIDLIILGSPDDEYNKFEEAIRYEYNWVSVLPYRKTRSDILQSFLDQERIYYNDVIADRYEENARLNLKWAIYKLTGH